jgi:hypothetical protein
MGESFREKADVARTRFLRPGSAAIIDTPPPDAKSTSGLRAI